MKRFLPAVLLVAAIVLSAPFMGRIRDDIFARFPTSAVRGLALVLAALAAAAFLYAVVRIRHRRLPRYAGLALVAALLWYQEAGFSIGSPQVDMVEKIHLVEYGLLAYLLYRAIRRAGDLTILLLPLLGVTFAGVLDETMQWLTETRLGETRDVLLDLYAGLCGLIFSLSLDPPERLAWRLSPTRRRLLSDTTGLVVLATGLFFNTANLGYEHDDPQIGRFRSWHSLDQLRRAAADRARRWQTNPPASLSPWHREDYFLTEAGWHVRHRQERHQAGDAYLAVQANRILEKYYGPFLDLESFRGSGRHRWPPEVRRDLESRAPRYDPRRYLSPVLIHRIYPWPSKRLFLGVLLTTVAAFWLLPRLIARL